jgi:tetratricopeptide (TPR) repeat protein
MNFEKDISPLLEADRLVDALTLIPAYLCECPDDGHAWLIYGECLRKIGRRSDAISATTKGLELASAEEQWKAHARLANLYTECGMRELAESHFTAALKSVEAQKNDWIWHLRGTNLTDQELFAAALDCFLKAAEVDSNNEDTYYLIGFVLRALERYEEAAVAAQKCLSIVPDYPKAVKLLKSLPTQYGLSTVSPN